MPNLYRLTLMWLLNIENAIQGMQKIVHFYVKMRRIARYLTNFWIKGAVLYVSQIVLAIFNSPLNDQIKCMGINNFMRVIKNSLLRSHLQFKMSISTEVWLIVRRLVAFVIFTHRVKNFFSVWNYYTCRISVLFCFLFLAKYCSMLYNAINLFFTYEAVEY